MKSLDKLVETLKEDDFKLTRQLYDNDEQFYLMTKKGVFPYDYFDSLERLEDTSLPSRQSFFNKMKNEECTMKVSFSIFFCSYFRSS